MSKIRFSVVALAAAALCGPSVVQAQQPAPTQTERAQPRASDDANQTNRLQNDQAARNEVRRASASTTQNAHGVTVTEAIAQKLKHANEAEIELAKLAMEKSSSEEVKQLAQTIVKDHQACIEKLEQLPKTQPQAKGQVRQAAAQQLQEAGQKLQDAGERLEAAQERQADQDRQTSQAQTRDQNRSDAADRQTTQNRSSTQGQVQSSSQMVPHELCKIAEQACENSLQMTKELLNEYEGQDFDMAYLGQQCVAHTNMLAELKAIESTGPQELQALAQEASTKVEQHLEKCKQIAKKLEDDRKSQS